MFSGKLFSQLNQTLINIFGCSKTIPFAGLSVLACGNLHQLPPINLPTLYSPINNFNSATKNGTKYSRMNQVKFVEDSV